MKTVVVHEWLVSPAGSEEVVKAILDLYPSPLYTLFASPEVTQKPPFRDVQVHTSFLQKIPGIQRHYRSLFPLFPLAIESFDLREYDVILSSSHAFAKGILRNADQVHICYCHTPIRYAWDLFHEYVAPLSWPKRVAARVFLHYIRMWDLSTVSRVDVFLANSRFVARRIQKLYGRTAEVIYPPVHVEEFPLVTDKEPYFVAASRFVPYKRMDLIVQAFAEMPDLKLVVVGDGDQFKRVKKLARGAKNIEFLGYQPRESLKTILGKARAFVFAAIEDFGILPVEAQACGTPVIAYGKGGVLETVVEGETGLFYYEQSPKGLQEAVRRFLKMEDRFDPLTIRKHAEQFSTPRFKERYRKAVERALEQVHHPKTPQDNPAPTVQEVPHHGV